MHLDLTDQHVSRVYLPEVIKRRCLERGVAVCSFMEWIEVVAIVDMVVIIKNVVQRTPLISTRTNGHMAAKVQHAYRCVTNVVSH